MRRCSMRAIVATMSAVLPATALLSACATIPPQERLSQTQAKTVEAGTARMAVASKLTWTLAYRNQPVDLTLHAEGVVDFAHNRLQVTQQSSNAGLSFSQEIIADEQALYMKSPLAQDRGKTWLGIDLSTGPIPAAAAGQVVVVSPTATLAFLENVPSEIKQVGTERVRGTPTTRYAVTIEARKALKQPGLSAPQRKEMKRALAGADIDAFTADVWIDRDQRLRKLHYRIEPESKDALGLETTLELFDFGAPPAVEPPATDQVLTASELIADDETQDLDKVRQEFDERIEELLSKAPKKAPGG
jgi:hypothetical protein